MSELIIKFKNLNWFFIFLVGFLSFVGLVMIYSATFGEESNILISHVYKIIFGFSLMILFGLVEIEFLEKKCIHFLFYWTCLVNYCLILRILRKRSTKMDKLLWYKFPTIRNYENFSNCIFSQIF